ncbi:MAG: C39 family peptidase [Planctomycetota bacterium]
MPLAQELRLSPRTAALAPLAWLVLAACAASDGEATGHEKLQEPTASTPAPTMPGAAVDPLHRTFNLALEATGGASPTQLQSEVITDGRPFTEALPSWNVPSPTPFSVDIRVREFETSPWGPWMRIGDWLVDERAEHVRTKFDAGKVAVDVLSLDRPFLAAQVRFQSDTPIAGPVEASLVLSDLRDLPAQVARTASSAWPDPTVVQVAPRSQRSVGDDIGGRICSPTSVAMVAAFHGVDIPTRKMAETLLDPHFDIYGNWNRAVQGPASLGLPGRLVRVSSWNTVREYLADGLPVVASIKAKEGELAGAPYKKTAGHLLVVTGLGPAGAVHVNDPAARYPLDVPRVYQRGDMENVWFRNGGVAYVFGERH